MIVSTFGPEGPMKCSGLDVVRYDAESLHWEFGGHFQLLESSEDCTRLHSGRCSSFSIVTAGWSSWGWCGNKLHKLLCGEPGG